MNTIESEYDHQARCWTGSDSCSGSRRFARSEGRIWWDAMNKTGRHEIDCIMNMMVDLSWKAYCCVMMVILMFRWY
jgi:hypothetical protein